MRKSLNSAKKTLFFRKFQKRGDANKLSFFANKLSFFALTHVRESRQKMTVLVQLHILGIYRKNLKEIGFFAFQFK